MSLALTQDLVRQTETASQPLTEFWLMPESLRRENLLSSILQVHNHHFQHNRAYRQAVSARGIGDSITRDQLPALLRPTAQTFKSYIDILGSPFPQDNPHRFLEWLADQLSITLPRQRFDQFRPRYRSLKALLDDIERIFVDFGLEISTSSGTSGRFTIMVRDQDSITKTVDSFYLSFQRYLGMRADHRVIFVMPEETRIAMVRMASFSVRRLGMAPEKIHYTIPYPAHPDQVRIRAGRTYRSGLSGFLEKRVFNPFMNWAYERRVQPRAIERTIELLDRYVANGEKILLFAGWVQLHAIALRLQEQGRRLCLAPGSLLGSGGGFKEVYPFSPEKIRHDLAQVFHTPAGEPVTVRDVYGMAEGNWAAMQCAHGNYHVPPWILVVTLDNDDYFLGSPSSAGRLAFFDPVNGGNLFPAFFKTADYVHLVNGMGGYDPALTCPCGDAGAYILQGSIQRVDLIDEAGCAAQV